MENLDDEASYILEAGSKSSIMPLHFMENRGLAGKGASTFASFSGYWRQGTVNPGTGFRLFHASGLEKSRGSQKSIRLQTVPAAFWPDGSLKWTFHTADFDADNKAKFSPVVEFGGKRTELSKSVVCREACGRILVDTGALQAEIFTAKNQQNAFLGKVSILGRTAIAQGRLVYENETRACLEDGSVTQKTEKYYGRVDSAAVEEKGDLQAVVALRGVHFNPKTQREIMPFVVRLTFRLGDPFIRIQHTFTYTGDCSSDFMRSLSIEFSTPLSGREYNRHIMFAGETADFESCSSSSVFHEANKLLLSWHPRIAPKIYSNQIEGIPLAFNPDDESSRAVDKVVSSIPAWNSYTLFADSADHWRITKGTGKEGCCMINAAEGRRTSGAAAVSGEDGGIVVCQRDFWQKYPGAISFENIGSSETSGEKTAKTIVSFWPSLAPAKDFRHYDTEGHSESYYEGYDFFGADPYGIANTNEMLIGGFLPHDGRLVLSHDELDNIARDTQKPALLVSSPEYYHDSRAFGIWSLPKKDGAESQRQIEKQLDDAISFYKHEVEQRRWYGFFDYGDVMHTYDPARHCWRYDMGGYAWQNTELVPTLWLWYSFLRTGREDIFTLAEAMSRHTSEVDIYHEGKYKGIGSRHNVIHWGCPCKEPRVAMAGHHRFAFYLIGDRRYADIFDIVKDGDFATLDTDPLAMFYDKSKMKLPTHARSGPDWSTYTSNWLTEWERHGEASQLYEQKIRTGIEDLKNAPLKLVSGNNFEYDPETGHLGYIGENSAGGTHLSVCMGGPQTWFELVPLLHDKEWNKMLADFGEFYFADKEEQQKKSKGLIKDREFSLPFMAAAMGAYGASYYKDRKLARKVWQVLLDAPRSNGSKAQNGEDFKPVKVAFCTSNAPVDEVPWITTNVTSQFCLNAIVCLELIGDSLQGV